MRHLDYIIWFLYFCWLPIFIIWLFWWRILAKYTKVITYCIIASIVFGGVWDYWATHYWLWHFSPDHTLNIQLLGLPIEEFIFFASETILYASVALILKEKIIDKK